MTCSSSAHADMAGYRGYRDNIFRDSTQHSNKSGTTPFYYEYILSSSDRNDCAAARSRARLLVDGQGKALKRLAQSGVRYFKLAFIRCRWPLNGRRFRRQQGPPRGCVNGGLTVWNCYRDDDCCLMVFADDCGNAGT